MSYKKLSPEAQARFAAINERFGLQPDEATHGPIDHPKGKTVVYSGDPLQSDVPPKIIHVASIADLRAMLRAPGHMDDEGVQYPMNLDQYQTLFTRIGEVKTKADLQASLSEQEKDAIRLASHAYVQGDPEKVKSFEPLINALMFPAKVAYFSSPDNKTISGTVEIKGSTLVTWNYNAITMEEGSQIVQQAPWAVYANTVQSADGSSGDIVIDNHPADIVPATAPDGPNGADGGKGDPGSAGTDYYNGSTCRYECVTPPGNGGTGGPGKNGTAGTAGSKGMDMNPLTWYIQEAITGNIVFTGGGGNGQNGGKGGNGGNGGPGGDPGPIDAHQVCTAGKQGGVGSAGAGADGGAAGPGGNGALVQIFYVSFTGQTKINQAYGQPGTPGQGGTAGTGNGGGGNGTNGASADPGTPAVVKIKPYSPS